MAESGAVEREGGYRPMLLATRVWLVVDSALVLLSGFQLFVLSEMTDRAFAWTIAAPITAAFLGAGYWAALVLVLWSSRLRYWAEGRLAVLGVWLFTTLTLIASVLHLDKFHLAAPSLGSRIAAWGWLVVYIVVPVALAVLIAVQLRAPGVDPARLMRMPVWARFVLVAQGVVMLALGVSMFLRPGSASWPWPLTPLTARAVASWLVAIGFIALQAAWENDWHRVRVAMAAYATLGLLQLVVLVRYYALIASRGGGIVYAAFLTGMLFLGTYGWSRGRRGTPSGG